MSKTVKFAANSSFQHVVSGPTNLIINVRSGTFDMVVNDSATPPDVDYSNTFQLNSSILSNQFGPFYVDTGSHVHIRTIASDGIFEYLTYSNEINNTSP